jgi:hypothetical protein
MADLESFATHSHNMSKDNAISAIAALVFLFTISAVCLAFGIKWWMWGAKSGTWQEVPGTITSFEQLGGTGRGVGRLQLVYVYSFNGNEHTSDRLCYGMPGKDRAKLARLTNGASVTVHVDPKDPSNAVLLPGVMTSALIVSMFGLCAVSFVALVAISTFSELREAIRVSRMSDNE